MLSVYYIHKEMNFLKDVLISFRNTIACKQAIV
nr:MAG TPA: hypothetical protein [Caudoviricetes sp.]